MTTPLIRSATLDDVAAIEAIVVEAYSPYIARIGRKPGPILDDYAALVADGQVHVCVLDGVVAGVLVLVAEADSLLLDNVAVASFARGKGVGRLLLEFAEAAALRDGFGTIRLYTHETMVENVVIYQRRGYRETHRGEEKGFRRVYMEKTLHEA
jgi:GNAT superfamily N-acetyltransferase